MAQRTDDPEFAGGHGVEGTGPNRGHHIETHVERARATFDEGVAGERRLARLMASKDPETGLFEGCRRLLDGPVVGADHEHAGRVTTIGSI